MSTNKADIVAHIGSPNYVRGISRKITGVRLVQAKNTRAHLKTNESQKGWGCGMVQSIEYLPSKCKALNSNPVALNKYTNIKHPKQNSQSL
jgi:hypothetical protein